MNRRAFIKLLGTTATVSVMPVSAIAPAIEAKTVRVTMPLMADAIPGDYIFSYSMKEGDNWQRYSYSVSIDEAVSSYSYDFPECIEFWGVQFERADRKPLPHSGRRVENTILHRGTLVTTESGFKVFAD